MISDSVTHLRTVCNYDIFSHVSMDKVTIKIPFLVASNGKDFKNF